MKRQSLRSGISLLVLCALATMPFARGAESRAGGERQCASSVAELTATALTELVAKKNGKFSFSAKSDCLVRDDHPPLPALLLELPEFPGPYVLRLESLIGDSFVMPRLEFYDGEGRFTRSVDQSAFRNRTTVVSADVFFRPEHAAERRVLVIPDPAALGKTRERTTLESRGAYMLYAAWFSGADTTVTLNQVEVGKLVVSLIGEPWEKKKKR